MVLVVTVGRGCFWPGWGDQMPNLPGTVLSDAVVPVFLSADPLSLPEVSWFRRQVVDLGDCPHGLPQGSCM